MNLLQPQTPPANWYEGHPLTTEGLVRMVLGAGVLLAILGGTFAATHPSANVPVMGRIVCEIKGDVWQPPSIWAAQGCHKVQKP